MQGREIEPFDWNFRRLIMSCASCGCMLLFDEHRKDAELRLAYPYFQGPEPLREEGQGCYAAPDAPFRSVTYVWIHPLADVIGSLLRSGLRIESFDEYPFVRWAVFPWMVRRTDGGWELPSGQKSIPLMFSLKATKDDPSMPLSAKSTG